MGRRFIFDWYGRMFLRVTYSISRQAEYAADAVSAEVAGTENAISALQLGDGVGGAFHSYMQSEPFPVLEAERRLPMTAGFMEFLQHGRFAGYVTEAGAQRDEETHRYDSHPPTGMRIDALAQGRAVPPQPEIGTSIDLIEELDDLELAVMKRQFRGARIVAFDPIAWPEVGEEIYLPAARRVREKAPREVLEGMTFGDLFERAGSFADLGRQLGDGYGADRGQLPDDNSRIGLLIDVASKCMVAALGDAGFSCGADLCEPLVLQKGEHALKPRVDLEQLAMGEATTEDTLQRYRAAGVAQLPLLAPVATA